MAKRINSKSKGKRGELEWARVCNDHGYNCRRTAQYCGNTGEASDVVGLPGIHQEVKRTERLDLYGAMFQAVHDAKPGEIPIVAHRRNDHKWVVIMEADDFFQLYSAWEAERALIEYRERKAAQEEEAWSRALMEARRLKDVENHVEGEDG